MANSNHPFNITLLNLTPQKLAGLRPVTVLDIFDGASSSTFNENGLFSVSTFGKVGDERRSLRFSFIAVKVPILHPIIYRTLVAMKRIYAGIMAGTEYVLWNNEIKDFERSDPINGMTGFAYFMDHWKEIKHEETNSDARIENIKLLKKYEDSSLTENIVVIPAGIRDVEIDDNGRVAEDEVNEIYRRILSIANSIPASAVRQNPEVINASRYRLQIAFNDLYDNLEARIEGKHKLIMGRWASRRIFNGTRNVMTALDTSTPYLGAPGTISFNDTALGLYQFLKSILPVATYMLRTSFLTKVFYSADAPAKLVNKKTLQLEDVPLKTQHFDRWMTNEGLEKVIASFKQESMRHKPIEIEGRYLALVYKGPDNTFKIMQDIRELPEGRNEADVYPMTFCEFLYLACYKNLNKYPVFVARYPITGMTSIYPSKAFVKTTVKVETRRELDEHWELMSEDNTAYQFPITGNPFINSMQPHTARLAGLTAD